MSTIEDIIMQRSDNHHILGSEKIKYLEVTLDNSRNYNIFIREPKKNLTKYIHLGHFPGSTLIDMDCISAATISERGSACGGVYPSI